MFIISTQPVPPPPIITCTWWCHTSTSHAHHCVLPQYQQHCTYYIQYMTCIINTLSTHSSLCKLRTNCTTTLSRASTPPFPYCTYTVNVSVLPAPCCGSAAAYCLLSPSRKSLAALLPVTCHLPVICINTCKANPMSTSTSRSTVYDYSGTPQEYLATLLLVYLHWTWWCIYLWVWCSVYYDCTPDQGIRT